MTDKFFDKLSKQLTLKQLWKDGIWLQNQVAAKRLSLIQLQYLEIFKKVLEEVYPNNWDFNIQIQRRDRNRNIGKTRHVLDIEFYPVIRFSNISIQNSRKQIIPIKDIFVRIPYLTYNQYYTKGNFQLYKIEGARNILSYNEYNNGYLHSHLPCTKIENYKLKYQPFCTGSGEINFMFTKLNQGFTEEKIKLLLFHLKGYLEWESLEGKPHIKLESLFLKNKNEGIEYLNYNSIYNKSHYILKHRNIIPVKLNWYIDKDSYRIKDDDNLEEFCRKHDSLQLYKYHYGNTNDIYYKDEQNNYYPINSTIETVIVDNNASLIFQGKEHKMIIEGLLDNTQDRQFYIHPKIKLHVKRQLELAINKRAIKYSAINAL